MSLHLLGLVVHMFVAPVLASEPLHPGGPVDSYGAILRIVLSLVAVLALIWAASYFLRKVSPKGARNSAIQVLERSYIAPKKAIYLVQIGSRTLAVGVTDNGMSSLAELDPEEFVLPSPAETNGRAQTTPFLGLLKETASRMVGSQTGGSPS